MAATSSSLPAALLLALRAGGAQLSRQGLDARQSTGLLFCEKEMPR